LYLPHLWSLSLEEQFYLIIPTLIFFCKKETIKKIAIISIVVYPLVRFFGYIFLRYKVEMLTPFGTEPLSALYNFFYRSSLFQFDAFMYGILIPLISYDNRKVLRWIVIVSFFVLAASQVYNIIDLARESHESIIKVMNSEHVIMRNGQFAYINTLYNILGATLFYYLLKYPDSFVNKPLRFSFFKNCGRIVYGIYVYHPLFIVVTWFFYLFIFKKYLPLFFADVAAIAFCFTLTYYAAKLSFYKFEMPFLMMKAKRSEQKKI
jgi:peptidoglycan/LPS O-acetylase OafA/YrhL